MLSAALLVEDGCGLRLEMFSGTPSSYRDLDSRLEWFLLAGSVTQVGNQELQVGIGTLSRCWSVHVGIWSPSRPRVAQWRKLQLWLMVGPSMGEWVAKAGYYVSWSLWI